MTIRLGFIGTGGIASWHLRGLAALRREEGVPNQPYQLVALADPRREAAEALAAEAADVLGERPAIYDDYRTMLERERLDAASILVPHHLHWTIARDCLDAGLHLQLQKPIALTVAEGHRIIDHARQRGRALVVSEPSVLGRDARALIAALHAGEVVDRPIMVLDYAVTVLSGGFFAGTPWRHLKGMAGGGWFVDHGVHRAHWFLDALGPIDEAFGRAATFEPAREDSAHGRFSVDTEDCAMALLQFSSGVLGHWLVASAGHGATFDAVRVYGTSGAMDLTAGTAHRDDGSSQPLEEVIARYRDPRIPSDAMAHSFAELYALIAAGQAPDGSPERALEALAVVYACLEAHLIGRPVTIADVLSGAANEYETSIEASRSLVATQESD